jgi:acyl-CoA dehydrogenase
MRWGGLGRRALEIAMARIETREAFGVKLADRESVQMMVGEAAMQLDIGRMLTMRAAWKLDQGTMRARRSAWPRSWWRMRCTAPPTPRCSCSARSGTRRTPVVEWIYRYARQARLVDGASEVHRGVLANFLRREGDAFFGWGHHAHDRG